MGRGRKPANENIASSWNDFYLKNLGFYLQAIIFELSKTRISLESGHDLIEKIRARLNSKGTTGKTSAKSDKEDIPIPENWGWCKLGEICSKIGSGSTPKGGNYSSNGIPFFRSQNIHNHGLVHDDIKFISEEVHQQMKGTLVLPDDILLNITGGSMGRCALVPTDFVEGNVSQHVCIIRPLLVDNAFFHVFFLTPYFQHLIFSSSTGAGREGLPKYNLENFLIPVPPLSEQDRIIGFLRELKNENIKSSGQYLGLEIEERIINLHKSQLLASEILVENSSQLTLLTQLNQAILQEAVQGQLVPQDPQDEPASVLLQRIKAEKEKLGKKEKALPPIKLEEVPFEVPEGWVWCRLGEIAQLITSGSRDWAQFYSSEGDIFVRMGNLSKDSFNLRMDQIQYVTPPQNQEGNRTRLEEGDILISITGEVGNLGLIPKNFGTAYINQHTAMLRLIKLVSIKYIGYLMLSKTLRLQFNAPQRGMKNSFRLSDIDFLLIPLPPLAEQARIVTAIEHHLAKTAALKAQVLANQAATEQLLQALLQEAFVVEAE